MKGHNFGLCLKCGKIHIHSHKHRGTPHTEETKKKISEALQGRHLSEAWKDKLRKALKGRVFSEETKKKMSQARSGEKGYQYRKDITERPCEHCGQMFRPNPTKVDIGEGRWCSWRCYNISRKAMSVKCCVCKKHINITPSRYKRNNNKLFFCSRECNAKYSKGVNNSFYGKKHTKQTIEKIRSNNWYRKGTLFFDVLKISRDEWLRRKMKGQENRPTKPEIYLNNLIMKYNLPFKYVGDGSVIIYGLNPDFIECNGKKKIIEVFGDYWHDPKKRKIAYTATEYGRKNIFAKLGYSTLILWEHELIEKNEKQIVERINTFINKQGV